ncbi:MAG: BcpO-related WXXGXW repeat protein [Rickettsiales bacterium]|nr:BcpO-related WXXGXW repeat protein [Rickettsiales bacterium]
MDGHNVVWANGHYYWRSFCHD